MQPNSVIIYHSQAEADRDYFWNQIAAPWIYEHWYVALGVIAALILLAVFISNRRR